MHARARPARAGLEDRERAVCALLPVEVSWKSGYSFERAVWT